ncbi:MAG: OFA family MFS transporter [Desulfobulbaceae bacterium]|nr:MAG: OFA family MFS transporter [Desulfobulbaceae bacterium]
MQRYLILAAAVLMQVCLGATYSWSVYVRPLKELTGLLQGPVQLPFTVFYFVFPATMLFAGSLLHRLGPRFCAIAGGILFGGGWLLASFGSLHFAFTVAGIGLCAGLGAGFAYIVPIATCIRWFPDNKGLVTGVAVAGFGGGAALISKTAGWLMNGQGWSPFTTFSLFGLIFLFSICLGGVMMRNPDEDGLAGTPSLAFREVVRMPQFILLYMAMITGLAAGFTVNANLKELFPAGTVQTGITAVAVFALANALGRVIWGFVADRLQPLTAIRLNLAAQALALFCSQLILAGDDGLLLFALLTGFNYGGVLVLYAATVAGTWGYRHVGQVYGWLFSANIPAALAPLIAGLIFDHTHSFTGFLRLLAIMLVVAIVLTLRFRKTFGHPLAAPISPS